MCSVDVLVYVNSASPRLQTINILHGSTRFFKARLRITHFLKLLHLVVVEPDQSRIFQAPHLSKVQHFQLSAKAAYGQDSWRTQGGWYAYDSPQAQSSKA